jgi:hypothetical protein
MMQMWMPVNHAYPHKSMVMHRTTGATWRGRDKPGRNAAERKRLLRAASGCEQGG